MVVGEAARADRFSLNGYEKETNPLLKKKTLINFQICIHVEHQQLNQFLVCFLYLIKADYDYKKGISTENVLDVLKDTNNIQCFMERQ